MSQSIQKSPRKDDEFDKQIRLKIGHLVNSVFAAIIETTDQAIQKAGKNPDDYVIRCYPFEGSKVDGSKVERKVLLSIRNSLRWTTRLP